MLAELKITWLRAKVETYLEKYCELEEASHGFGHGPRVCERDAVEERVKQTVPHVHQRDRCLLLLLLLQLSVHIARRRVVVVVVKNT